MGAKLTSRVICTIAALGLPMLACTPRPASPRWFAVEVPTDATFDGLWFADSLNGWMAGGGWDIDGGIVGRTRDGGQTWRFESGILSGGERGAGLGSVQFRDTLRGCLVAGHGSVLVTADGGESWRPAKTNSGGSRLADLQFVDDHNGWAAGTQILHSDDAGETWAPRFRSASENGYLTANAVHFLSDSHGWLVSHSGTLARTDDGGEHWERVDLPLRAGERPTLWDITFVNADQGWITGEQGNIFHTSDGGTSWDRQENGVPIVRVIPRGEPRRPREVVPELETEPDRLSVAAIQFADPEHGWAVGYYADVAESVVLSTDDNGATWRTEHVQPGELLRSLFVLDREHAWAAGDRARTTPQVVLRYARMR